METIAQGVIKAGPGASRVLLIVGWMSLNLVFQPSQPHPATMLAGLGATLATVAALRGPLILLSQHRTR